MDRRRLKRLNEILRKVSSRNRPIDDLDEIPSWFEGTAEDVNAKANEVRVLFDEAYDNGMINRWVEEHTRRGPSTNWDWTTAAHKKAQKVGVELLDPLGNSPIFEHVSNQVMAPIEMVRVISTDALDDDACGCLDKVYQEQVRYIVRYRGKPIAAIVTLVDFEMLKDVQAETEPIRWLEWIQELRQRLGWPAVTFNDAEKNSDGQ